MTERTQSQPQSAPADTKGMMMDEDRAEQERIAGLRVMADATTSNAAKALIEDRITNGRKVRRMQRRIASRDAKIAGLQRRIAALEHALALRSGDAVVVNAETLRLDIQKAVQRALGSVRMVPVLGIGANDRVLEVKVAPTEQDA